MIEIERIKEKVFTNLKENPIETNEIVYKVVDTTTIRAFHYKKDYQNHQPLSIYRVWAYDKLNEENSLIFNCKNFEDIHTFYCNSFKSFWLEKEEISLPIYKVNKIVDLFFKGVTLWKNISYERRKFFLENVHCPLDYFSLKYLKQKSTSLSNEIKDGVTMKFIENVEQYNRYQKEIKNISNEMGITPYIFDEIAWQIGHNENGIKEPPKLIDVKRK